LHHAPLTVPENEPGDIYEALRFFFPGAGGFFSVRFHVRAQKDGMDGTAEILAMLSLQHRRPAGFTPRCSQAWWSEEGRVNNIPVYLKRSARLLRVLRWPYVLVLTLLVVRFWLMPLPSSLWLDATGTVFVAKHGSHDPSLLGAAPQAWTSWYYPFIHCWGNLFGYSEVSLRIPSVVAMLVLLAIVARLSIRLIHADSGWLAVFACFAFPGISYNADNVRPYAFGMCLFAGGLLFLVRWLDSVRWLDAALFLACAASVLYVHLMFWPSYPVLALYAVSRVWFRQTQAGWLRVLTVFTALGLALVPPLLQMLSLLPEAHAHVTWSMPTRLELLHSLALTRIVACAAGALLFRYLGERHLSRIVSAPAVVLVAGWWACQPVLLYCFSMLTGNSVFAPRYVQLGSAGAAVACVAAASLFLPADYWKLFSIAFGIATLLYLGQWSVLLPSHDTDWRGAAAAANRAITTSDTPVLCPSPFVEARPPVWYPEYSLNGFLYAHMGYYPIKGKVYPFPFDSSVTAETFAAKLASSTLPTSNRFLIYGREDAVRYWRGWFSGRAEFAGWRQQQLGEFNEAEVVQFDKN